MAEIVTDCKSIAISALGGDLQTIIENQATLAGLDPILVKAMVEIESGGNSFRTKVEPNWQYRFKSGYFAKMNKITVDTENVLQSMSWGLLQVMGTVAREQGFEQPLTMLCIPEIGLEQGIKKLSKLMLKYNNNVDHAVAAYNAGSLIYSKQGNFINQGYVSKVLEKYGELLSAKVATE